MFLNLMIRNHSGRKLSFVWRAWWPECTDVHHKVKVLTWSFYRWQIYNSRAETAMGMGHRIADSADVFFFELDLEKSGLELGITWLYMRLKWINNCFTLLLVCFQFRLRIWLIQPNTREHIFRQHRYRLYKRH